MASITTSGFSGIEKELAAEIERVLHRVDADGQVIGFSILGVSRFTKEQPLEAS